MTWYEIVVGLMAAVGGLGGIAAFIKSFMFTKQEKKEKDLENDSKKLDNKIEKQKDYAKGQIIRQDITKMNVDAIVNTTNEEMVGYSGVDLAVHNVP